MFPETGQMALALALAVSLAQGIIPLLGSHRRQTRLMMFADRAAIAQALLLIYAFGVLTYVFITSDFSVKLAASHSHSGSTSAETPR